MTSNNDPVSNREYVLLIYTVVARTVRFRVEVELLMCVHERRCVMWNVCCVKMC